MCNRLPLFLFICLMLFFCQFAQSQTDTLKTTANKGNIFLRLNRKLILWAIREPKPFYDTNYVRTSGRVFTLGAFISSKKLKMKFMEKTTENEIQYNPATTYSPGIFINTSLFGFSIAPSFLALHQNSSKRGISNFNDYQFNIYARRFFYDISLQSYNGFYLNNTQAYTVYKYLENYYKRSDITATSTNFNVYYVFNNRKFSVRAPFSYVQSQIKSAGSFIIGTYLSNFTFGADSSVIGSQIQESFTTFPSLKKGDSFSTGLSFGYAYTYVSRKKIYISAAFIPGLGVNHLQLERMDHSVFSGENNLSVKLKFTFGIGYDNKKWFWGCMFWSDNYHTTGSISPIEIDYQISKLRFFIGRRFDAKKTERKILRKLRVIE